MCIRDSCQIYAPFPETVFAQRPELSAALMYGAAPPAAMRIPRLMAQPSSPRPLRGSRLAPDFELCPLDGHAPAMVGVKTRDNVWFIGDALLGEERMRKYQIHHLYHAGEYLRTLRTLERLEGAVFVPSHAPATDTLLPLIIQNRVRIEALMEMCIRDSVYSSLPSCLLIMLLILLLILLARLHHTTCCVYCQ